MVPENDRLEGWKQIAGHLKCSPRAAQRKESKGLPVHRHDAFGNVFAYKSEVDAWLAIESAGKPKADDAREGTQDAGASNTGGITEREDFRHRMLSNRRIAVLMVALVLAALALFVVVELRTRFRPPRTLAVVGFRNVGGREDANWLSVALSEMLQADLAATGKIRLVPGEDVARMKRELGLADSDGFSKDTLDRVRRNVGADILLFGSYVSLGTDDGDPVRLNLVLQDTRTGIIIGSFTDTGSKATLFGLGSRAGSAIRAALNLGGPMESETVRINSAVPRSLDAQRLYSRGIESLRRGEAAVAKDSLEGAVGAEPSYALAHKALAEAWSVLGYEAKSRAEANLAFDLSATLAPNEALLIEAEYRERSGQWHRAIEIYRRLCQFAPNELDYWLHLAQALTSAGKGKEAVATFALIRRQRFSDSEGPKIDLTEAANAEALSDFRRELAVSVRAAQVAEVRGTPVLAARAYLRQSWAHYRLSEPDRAVLSAERAKRIFVSVGDRGGEAQALKNIGDAVGDRGDHAQAKQLYEAALKIFREIGQQAGVAVTLNNLGYEVRSLGDLEGARRLFEASLFVGRETGDRSRQAQALNGIAIILWRQGNLTAAARTYEEALGIHMERGDIGRAATVLNNLAIVQQDQGHLAEAQKRFEQALEMLRQLGDQSGVARTTGNLGELLLLAGDLAGAEKNFTEQSSIGRAIRDDVQASYALCDLGRVLLEEGDLSGARAKEEQALALRKKMQEKGLVAESQLVLAQIALEEGNAPAAAAASRDAAGQFASEKELDEEAASYAVLAQALIETGKRAEAQDNIGRAIKRVGVTEDRAARLSIGLDVARIRIALSQVPEGIGLLRPILDEAKKYGYVVAGLEARLVLAQAKAQSRADLEALQKDAAAKGFGLIARKATALLKPAE